MYSWQNKQAFNYFTCPKGSAVGHTAYCTLQINRIHSTSLLLVSLLCISPALINRCCIVQGVEPLHGPHLLQLVPHFKEESHAADYALCCTASPSETDFLSLTYELRAPREGGLGRDEAQPTGDDFWESPGSCHLSTGRELGGPSEYSLKESNPPHNQPLLATSALQIPARDVCCTQASDSGLQVEALQPGHVVTEHCPQTEGSEGCRSHCAICTQSSTT